MRPTSDQTLLKSAPRIISMSIWLLKCLRLGFGLALLLVTPGFADHPNNDFGPTWQSPPGQPHQMWSRVQYDPKLADPFFDSNEWSYDIWYDLVPPDERPDERPRLKHTANCVSTSFGMEHPVVFCRARFVDVYVINLLIYYRSPGCDDALKVQVRNGSFTCQYWTPRYRWSFRWTTKRQKLTLDKKTYRRGEMIKGRIEFECVQELSDLKGAEHYSKGYRNPRTIRVSGVFKPILE